MSRLVTFVRTVCDSISVLTGVVVFGGAYIGFNMDEALTLRGWALHFPPLVPAVQQVSRGVTRTPLLHIFLTSLIGLLWLALPSHQKFEAYESDSLVPAYLGLNCAAGAVFILKLRLDAPARFDVGDASARRAEGVER
jgi:hypothetical protein